MTRTARPLRWYRGTGWRTRLHVGLRWATAPFAPVEQLLPAEGRILDWGCGHGVLAIWLAATSPDREVEGVDIDGAKLEAARRAAAGAGLGERVTFRRIEPGDQPPGSWDGVLIDDVLYLLHPRSQEQLVRAAAAAVGPGGVLVIKDMGTEPAWKRRLTVAQEWVAVRLLRITATGAGVHPSPAATDLVRWMQESGLATEVRRLDRGYHCPHMAVAGRRPGRLSS